MVECVPIKNFSRNAILDSQLFNTIVSIKKLLYKITEDFIIDGYHMVPLARVVGHQCDCHASLACAKCIDASHGAKRLSARADG